MTKTEIKSMLESLLLDKSYLGRLTEILYQEINRPKLPNLTKKDIDQPCLIRLEGCTGFGADLAHLRMHTGIGKKSHDLLSTFACRNCHIKTESNPEMRVYFLEAMARRIDQYLRGMQ